MTCTRKNDPNWGMNRGDENDGRARGAGARERLGALALAGLLTAATSTVAGVAHGQQLQLVPQGDGSNLAPRAVASQAASTEGDAGRVEPTGGERFLRGLLYGPVGRTIGNAAYRGTFYELDYTYESTPWLGDGTALAGIAYHENRGAIVNSFVAIAMSAAAASSRQTSVYVGSDDYYDYYRGMTTEEQAREDQRVQEMMDSAAELATDRPLSMRVRLYHEDLGSDMTGGQINVAYPIWIDAWGGGIVIEPGIGGAYAERHHGSGNVAEPLGGTYGWFGAEVDLRVPVLEFVGLFAHGLVGFTGDKPRQVSLGGEASLGNRFMLRGSLQLSSVADQSVLSHTGARFELGVRW